MDLEEYINTIKNHMDFGPSFVHHRYLPPIEAIYGPDPALPDELLSLPQHLGIKGLYKHQVDALRRIRQGANVLVAGSAIYGSKEFVSSALVAARIRALRQAAARKKPAIG